LLEKKRKEKTRQDKTRKEKKEKQFLFRKAAQKTKISPFNQNHGTAKNLCLHWLI